MNRNLNRIMAVLLCAVLTVTSLAGLALPAAAEEVTVTNSYVLQYDGEDAQPYLYGSRFSYDHSYSDPAAGESSVWSYNNCPEIFNLVGPNGSVAAYCTDADTGTESDTYYRRMNLEDSTYHADGAAARLRSVILNSFPKLTVEEVAAAANAAGFTVTDLSQGELISATQQAIWEITHGEKYTVDDHYDGIRSMYSYDETEFVYPESLEAVATEYTEANMTALYNYFLSLEGTEPLVDVVSEFSLVDPVTDVVVNADGSYNVTVTVTVQTTVKEEDTLNLTATTGAYSQSKELTEAGTYSFTFEALAAVSDITIVISGYQMGGDVYLFDADGDRTVSQSMVGYDATLLPVYGEITVTPDDRIVNFHKTADDAEKTPLENITFKIYQVGAWEDFINGKLTIGTVPTDEEIDYYTIGKTPVATVTTDENGFASHDFGKVDGVYLVVEEQNPVITETVRPFFLCVPGMDAASGKLDYIIDISPKNEVITEEVVIEKDVTEIDQDEDTFDVGEEHTWIIQSSIPAGLASGLKYEIIDELDYRLTYVGNLKVTVANVADLAHQEAVKLTEGTHYDLEKSTTTDAEGRTVDYFVVSLTEAGRQKVAEVAAADTENTYEIRVYFDAYINTAAGSDVLGEDIPNDAHVDYTNNVGLEYKDDSDKPVVHTGGLNLLKVDASNNSALSGATFVIARVADADEQVDFYMDIDGVQTGMVYAQFYNNAQLIGEKVGEVTTDAQGKAVIYGLAYGTYYLIETQAPDGYNPLTLPKEVLVSATSHSTDSAEGGYVTVANSPEFELPGTGGIGTTAFYVIGLMIIAVAAGLYIFVVKRKTA